MKSLNKRETMFDILRIIAIFMVLYNHRYTFSCSDYFDTISVKYIISAALSIICKCRSILVFYGVRSIITKKRRKF